MAAAYARDVAAAHAVHDEAARCGATVTLHQADVGEPTSCQRLVAEVLEQHGRLDYLVNNAGMVNEQRLSDVNPEDWHRQLAVNLSSAFFLSQAALAHMTQQRFGRVVNIGSVTALMGSPVQVAYGAAKGGIVGLTRSCARAVARKGITVNCVIPGSFDTDLSAELVYTDRDAVTSMIPVGRWGRPEELAHAVDVPARRPRLLCHRRGPDGRRRNEHGRMRMNRTRLTATDIVAPPVAPDRLAEYRRFGYVSDLTMSASVVRAARQWGSRPAVIEGGHQLTYQELLEVVERAAAWLAGAGVGPGDVVCWQTPNWWEAHVLGLAIWHAGAVSCPIAPFYREHELRQVIEQVRPAAVVTAETFRGFAHAEAFDDLLAGAGLGDVARVVLRGTRPGWSPFDVGRLARPAPGVRRRWGRRTLPDPLHFRDHLGCQGRSALLAHLAG